MKRLTTIVGTLALVLGAAGPVYAGNGNGGGNGNGNAPAAAESSPNAPGNSGNAPGHQETAGTPGDAPGNSASAPGQVKQEQAATTQAPAQVPTDPGSDHGKPKTTSNSHGNDHGNSGNPAGSPGLKPTNSTEHNFYAPAGSNRTKRYGNGQTAGQIAMVHGASPDTPLYSPGNSQPHKIAPCGRPAHGKGGGIDVHALKGHAGKKGCDAEEPPSTTPASGGPGPSETPPTTTPGGSVSPPTSGQQPTATGSTPSTDSGGSESHSSGGHVEGASASAGKTDGGVLGAAATLTTGTLPFTGAPLLLVALLGLALIGAGLVVRRQASPAA
jgi:hypothetical protein